MMKSIIEMDFDAEIISEYGDETLFVSVKPLFYQFIWLKSQGDGYRLEQFHILRYELASFFEDFMNREAKKFSYNLLSEECFVFIKNGEDTSAKITHHYSDAVFDVNVEGNTFIPTLKDDYKTISNFAVELSDEEKIELLSKIANPECLKSTKISSLYEEDFRIIQFELKRIKRLKGKNADTGLYKLYKILLCDNLSKTDKLKQLLVEYFEIVYSSETGDDEAFGEFSEILKSNQKDYFNGEYKIADSFDNQLLCNDFDVLWNKLTPRQQAGLLYLSDDFENLTLLNLAFIRPNFNPHYYQSLMCQPYQPDSSDNNWVRTVSSLVWHFMRGMG